MIIDYAENFALPLLDRMEDIRELDREINEGIPWITDWAPTNLKAEFSLAGNFSVKRLIIGRLAGRSMDNLQSIFDYMMTEWKKAAEQGNMDWEEYFGDVEAAVVYTMEFLKDIEPLNFEK